MSEKVFSKATKHLYDMAHTKNTMIQNTHTDKHTHTHTHTHIYIYIYIYIYITRLVTFTYEREEFMVLITNRSFKRIHSIKSLRCGSSADDRGVFN